MFSKLKSLLRKIPVPLTKNHRYDLLTKRIIRQHCRPESNCIDAGTHKGEVLDWFLKYCPQGQHFAFEPVPSLFRNLAERYAGTNAQIYPVALSNMKGLSPFNFVISNPAYSGLKRRTYDRQNEIDTTIMVQTDTLDNLVPEDTPIHFIKIDVEGGELNVLKGATRILRNHHPVIIFEFGIGGSDVYGVTPEEMYAFLSSFNYKIFLLEDFIRQRHSLSSEGFQKQFREKLNYYFAAY
jgi:FkbM family methyltransferase